jgi:uncharacterized RDD family membrane protein YckC
MPATEWIVARGEQQFPVPDLATLKEWVATGKVATGDRIWHPVSGQWAMAREIPEIADAWVRPDAGATVVPPLAVSVSATEGVSNVGLRAVGYIIDVVPAVILGLIGLVPIVGQFIAGVLMGSYWLFRDINGASLGKLVVGTRVVAAGGGEATANARILRNLPLCIGPFLLAVPIAGYVLGPTVASLAFLIELIMLLTQGSRLGDKFAGTVVVKK